jgi:septal ring factor EnvC (AmiA/AmiB activator)
MADILQIKEELTELKTVVADQQSAIDAIDKYVKSEADTITDLETQIANLKAAGDNADIDQVASDLADIAAELKAHNVALAAVVPTAQPQPPAGAETTI